MQELEDHTKKWRDSHVHSLQKSILVKTFIIWKIIYRCNAISKKIPMAFFIGME
jgi:hypothetical protein